MTPNRARLLGIALVVLFAAAAGWLSWTGFVLLTVVLVAAAAGYAALMSVASRTRDRLAARHPSQVDRSAH